MITKEQEKQLYLLRDKIEKETGVKIDVDCEKGSLSGFKAKSEQVKQVKEIIKDFYDKRERRGETDVYYFKTWESGKEKGISKGQEDIDKADQYELDLEPDRD